MMVLLTVYTTFNVLDFISRSQECQTVLLLLTENCMFLFDEAETS